MHRPIRTHRILPKVKSFPVSVLALTAWVSVAFAAFVPVAEGKGPPAGDGNAVYTIVDLPFPVPDANGWTQSISNMSSDGTVYVVGSYGDRACTWTMNAKGTVVVEDIDRWLWWADLDVNSAGIICGVTSPEINSVRPPALLLPNRQLVILEGWQYSNAPRLNNPNESGIFQVVGRADLWDVTVQGQVLARTSLVDPAGIQLYAYDINDHGEIAGVVYVDNDPSKEQLPAIGTFIDGQLQIASRANPNPEVITGFADVQIDSVGNLLGWGVEPSSGIGHYPRAVIWPVDGAAIDLVSEFRLKTAHADGIAWINDEIQVVGHAHDDSGSFAYRYVSGQLSDLGRISAGDQPWELAGVKGINEQGMICGYGKVGKRRNYQNHGCLLIPNVK